AEPTLGRNMRAPLDRDAFLALIQIKSTTLSQRIFTSEQAFTYGLRKPPHTNEYQPLYGFAAILASAINMVGRLDLKLSAGIVRERWDDWLTLIIRVESFPHIEQYLCIAHTSLDRSTPPHIAMGTAEEIGKVCPPSEHPVSMIPMGFLLRCLRENARRAG